MGFEVAYEIRDAGAGRGRGVFASRPIAAGALVWRFVEGENVTRHADEAAVRARLAALPSAEAARDWLDHAFFLGGALNEMHDDGIFFNHDEHNNTGLAAALSAAAAATRWRCATLLQARSSSRTTGGMRCLSGTQSFAPSSKVGLTTLSIKGRTPATEVLPEAAAVKKQKK